MVARAQETVVELDPATAGGPAAEICAAGLQSIEIGMGAMRALGGALGGELGPAFAAAVERLIETEGRVIVCGVGKSGHIGRKIAATLASTGTPAFFVHPTEASHGDLGMITPQDTILALSWSGETAELGDLTNFSRRFSIPLIAITSRLDSSLGRAADVVLALPRVRESCPHDLAPTSSSLIQLALGDALAVALLRQRGFTSSRFKILHPGGTLAARLKTVRQLMHAGAAMPVVTRGTPMSEVLVRIAEHRFGCAGVLDEAGAIVGIVTDGDLRRHMGPALLATPVEQVMTARPVTIEPDSLAGSALELMNRKRITAVFVVEAGRPVGLIHVHDLLTAGVV